MALSEQLAAQREDRALAQMTGNLPPTRFNQVALSVASRDRSLAFYRDVIGFTHVGGTEAFRGKTTEAVQGMAGAASRVYWLMDDRPYFQLELFEFESPKGHPFATNRRPSDVGYSRIRVAVPSIEHVRTRAAQMSPSKTQAPRDLNGAPALALHDPDGILIELREDAALGGPRLTGVALTVSSLDAARRSFVDGMGCIPISGPVEDCGVLWGETGADKQTMLLDGETITLEIAAYAKPASRPWPAGYRIADVGILNVALGFETGAEIKVRLAAMQAAGFKPNCPLVGAPGLFLVTYSNDPQGFSVETLMVGSLLRGGFGFRQSTAFDRAIMKILAAVS